MTKTTLPRQADLRKLAVAGSTITGSIAFADLSRLSGVLADDSGSVEVDLRIGMDDEGYRCIEGTVRSEPRLQCQRCLEPMVFGIDAVVRLAMVWREEEIPSLPSRFDGVVVGTESTDLYELVEEELLLALPLVPRHPDGECGLMQGNLQEDVGDARENPFAAALRDRVK